MGPAVTAEVTHSLLQFYSFICVCVYFCMCVVCVCVVYTYMCRPPHCTPVCVCRPEVDARSPPLWLLTFHFETGFLAEPAVCCLARLAGQEAT